MNYLLADIIIGVYKNYYKTFPMMAKDFETEYPNHDLYVEVSESDVDKEYVPELANHPRGYFHSIAIFRHLAEKLPYFDAFLLHSACFDVDGVGVAFAAHSGTGKTTHMLLWKELLGDRMTIVNGDKPIVRFFDDAADLETKNPVGNLVGDDAHIVPQDHRQINGIMDEKSTYNQPFAYGTPWNGKEHLGCNMRTPLRHICFIERAAENSCEPMTDRSDAVNRIFNQVYMPKDPMAAAKTIGLIDRLMKSCSLWIIKCNMEPSAAEVAYRTIFEKTPDPHGTM